MSKEPISKKSQQLRLYFAQTAKDMILTSGMESVSIRSIAKQAQYAYATIYNHFDNLDELLWLTRNLFMLDINEKLEKHTLNRSVKSNEDVCDLFTAYAEYFMEHPSVYRFLYLHPLKKEAKTEKSFVETDAYQEQFHQSFAYLAATKSPKQIENAIKTILYTIHGLLTLCISENDEIGFDTMRTELRRIIPFLLEH